MAVKPRAEYEIKAKDESKKGIDSAKGGLSKLSKGAGVAFKRIAKAAAIATAAVAAIGAVANKAVKMYAEQEKAEIKLAAASRNNPLINGDGVQSLFDFADALQKTTGFSDDLIISQEAFLTTLQLSQDQIEGVLFAATDLASTGMMSLDSAVKNIAKTYGGMAGELGELIPAMRDLTAEQLKNGEAVDLIAKNYKGMAEAVASSTAGIEQDTKNMAEDMMQAIGETLAPVKNTLLNAFQPAFDKVIQWFTVNQKPITNFFLHLGDIATSIFTRIGEGLIQMFSLTHAMFSFKALTDYMVETWKNTKKTLWAISDAVDATMYVPLENAWHHTVYGMKVGWIATMNALKKGLLWFIDGPVTGLGDAFRTIVGGIGDALSFVMNGIMSLINVVLTGVDKMLEGLHKAKEFAIKINPLDKTAPSEYKSIIPKVSKEFDFDWMDKEVGKLSERVTGLADALDPKDISLIQNNAETTTEALARIGDSWKNVGNVTVDTYVENMKNALSMNKDIFATPFIDAFDGFGKEFKGILYADLPESAKDIAEEISNGAIETIEKSYSSAVPGLRRDFNITFGDIIGDIGNRIKESLGEGGDLEALGTGLSMAGSGLLAFGKYLLDGLMAIEAFTSAMEVLSEAIGVVFDSLIKPLMVIVRPLIGILVQFAQIIGQALMPFIVALVNTLEALVPIIAMLGDFLAQLLVPIVNVLAVALEIITDLLVQLTPVFKVLFEMILNILTPVLNFLAQILTALAPVFKLIGDILLAIAPVLESIGILIAEILGPALTLLANIIGAILNPVMTILSGIMQILTPIFKVLAIIMKALAPLFNILFQFISLVLVPLQILGVIINMLNPVFEFLAYIVGFLVPIFEFLALVVDAVTRPLEFFADMITYVVDVLGAVAHNIGQFFLSLISFGMAGGDYKSVPSFSSDAFSRPLGQSNNDLASVTSPDYSDIPFDGGEGSSEVGSYSGSSSAGAAYGGTNLTVNVTIQAEAIVGEPGLREFALMINDEITSAKTLGVA